MPYSAGTASNQKADTAIGARRVDGPRGWRCDRLRRTMSVMALSPDPEGTVAVTFDDYRNPADLQLRLRAAGVRATVLTLPNCNARHSKPRASPTSLTRRASESRSGVSSALTPRRAAAAAPTRGSRPDSYAAHRELGWNNGANYPSIRHAGRSGRSTAARPTIAPRRPRPGASRPAPPRAAPPRAPDRSGSAARGLRAAAPGLKFERRVDARDSNVVAPTGFEPVSPP